MTSPPTSWTTDLSLRHIEVTLDGRASLHSDLESQMTDELPAAWPSASACLSCMAAGCEFLVASNLSCRMLVLRYALDRDEPSDVYVGIYGLLAMFVRFARLMS
jgi:hypothetical protein